jgi:Xaa-Pro aminopeptidase
MAMYQHIESLQSVLKKNGMDVAVMRLPENLTLFSQYWPRNANSLLIVPQCGKPALICPESESEDLEAEHLDNIHYYSGVKISDKNPYDQMALCLEKIAKENSIGGGAVIGAELGYDRIAPCFCSGKISLVGAKTLDAITRGFDSDRIVSLKDLLVDIMAIKNESDIAKLETVNKLAHMGMAYFEELAQTPGMREVDIVSDVESFLAGKARGLNGTRAARAWGQLSTGLKSVDASCEGVISDERRLEKGDFCLYELGLAADGYWADITYSTVVGGCKDIAATIRDLVQRAFDAGVAAVRDGISGREVDAATRKVMENAGYGKYYIHAAGHGVGFTYHEPAPELHPASDDVLREGMVVAIEPGLYIPAVGGFRLEKNVLVRRNDGLILGL